MQTDTQSSVTGSVLGGPHSSFRCLVDHSVHSLCCLAGCGQSSMGGAEGDAPFAGSGGRRAELGCAGLGHLTDFSVQGNFCVRAVALL